MDERGLPIPPELMGGPGEEVVRVAGICNFLEESFCLAVEQASSADTALIIALGSRFGLALLEKRLALVMNQIIVASS